MINILKNISRINSLKEKKYPKHIAISTRSLKNFQNKEKDIIDLASNRILEFIKKQIKLNIPIFTIKIENKDELDKKLIEKIIQKLNQTNILTENKMKFMLIGKWYDLNRNLIDEIKKTMNQTSSYDNFFINILFNYSGQEELFSAIKLLTIKAQNKKIDLENLDLSIIKDSIYTSYFVPPELIIETGHKYTGTLLWDSPGAVIYFTQNIFWFNGDKKIIEEGLNTYKKSVILPKKETKKESIKEQEN
jgi:undecaprenyl diphosphate synthase